MYAASHWALIELPLDVDGIFTIEPAMLLAVGWDEMLLLVFE